MGAYGSPELAPNQEPAKKVKKSIFKRWWFWAIAAIIIISAFTNGREDEPKAVNNSPSGQTATESTSGSPKEGMTEEETPKFFKLGETVETKTVKAAITGMEKPTGSSFNKPAEGKEFILLNVTVENISDSELNISSMLGINAYVDDEAISESLSAQMAKDDTKTLDGTIAAGKKLSGTLGYEVPKDWKQIEIHFQPDVYGNTTIKWLVENK